MKRTLKNRLWSFISKYVLVKQLMILRWKLQGRPAPPPHAVKQQMIRSFIHGFNYKIFVETGTYLGAMIRTILNDFSRIYTVELSEPLHRRAEKIFNNYPHIHCLQGDSGVVLHRLVPELKSGAIFWLDGHYSGGITALGNKVCPIFEELDAIIANDNHQHIILIDDARLFLSGEQGYPTLDDVKRHVQQKGPYNFHLLNTDTIVVTKVNLNGNTGIDRYLQAR